MAMLIDKDAAYTALKHEEETHELSFTAEAFGKAARIIDQMPIIEAEPVRHGRWIECDYKRLEHGMLETEPNAGLCCSECRTAFQKKKMTYKQYCAACGARMDEQDGMC